MGLFFHNRRFRLLRGGEIGKPNPILFWRMYDETGT